MKPLFCIVALLNLVSWAGCSAKHGVGKMGHETATPAPSLTPPPQAETPKPTPDPKQEAIEAQTEKFKTAPPEFKTIDFQNFSYPYKFSYNKKKIRVALKDGEYEFDFLADDGDRGWFSFKDVYYVDLTNNGNKEALVMLWHVSCGASCDGGAALLYLYQAQRNKPKLLWQYETGSTGYGCGLKSLTVKNRKIALEVFGRCREDNTTDSATSKFGVKDLTRLVFGFHNGKFVREKKEFIDAPERDVKNYEPEISISE